MMLILFQLLLSSLTSIFLLISPSTRLQDTSITFLNYFLAHLNHEVPINLKDDTEKNTKVLLFFYFFNTFTTDII